MDETGEVVISSSNHDEAFAILKSLGGKDQLKRNNEGSSKMCRFELRGEEIHIISSDIESTMKMIQCCQSGKNLKIEIS